MRVNFQLETYVENIHFKGWKSTAITFNFSNYHSNEIMQM